MTDVDTAEIRETPVEIHGAAVQLQGALRSACQVYLKECEAAGIDPWMCAASFNTQLVFACWHVCEMLMSPEDFADVMRQTAQGVAGPSIGAVQ